MFSLEYLFLQHQLPGISVSLMVPGSYDYSDRHDISCETHQTWLRVSVCEGTDLPDSSRCHGGCQVWSCHSSKVILMWTEGEEIQSNTHSSEIVKGSCSQNIYLVQYSIQVEETILRYWWSSLGLSYRFQTVKTHLSRPYHIAQLYCNILDQDKGQHKHPIEAVLSPPEQNLVQYCFLYTPVLFSTISQEKCQARFCCLAGVWCLKGNV